MGSFSTLEIKGSRFEFALPRRKSQDACHTVGQFHVPVQFCNIVKTVILAFKFNRDFSSARMDQLAGGVLQRAQLRGNQDRLKPKTGWSNAKDGRVEMNQRMGGPGMAIGPGGLPGFNGCLQTFPLEIGPELEA